MEVLKTLKFNEVGLNSLYIFLILSKNKIILNKNNKNNKII